MKAIASSAICSIESDVEGDDVMLGRDAVHDTWIPVVQHGGQMSEKHHGCAAVVLSEFAVGEVNTANGNGSRLHSLPSDLIRLRCRGFIDGQCRRRDERRRHGDEQSRNLQEVNGGGADGQAGAPGCESDHVSLLSVR
jgi:hypothetical protein